jgi:hypothetical protein
VIDVDVVDLPGAAATEAPPVAEAIAELRRCSGTDFDPAVVDA